MTNRSILTWFELDNVSERREYERIWRSLPLKRPHDHPDYLDFMRPQSGRAAAVYYKHSDSDAILYAFHYRKLNEIPAFADVGSCIHIVSPYGYGGPIYEGNSYDRENAEKEFMRLFQQELLEKNCVSEFVREDIFRDALVNRIDGKQIEQQQNVVVRLNRKPEEIWSHYKHKVRKNVNKAKSFQLEVVFDRDGKFLDDFVAIYHETMRRSDAKSDFFISQERFARLVDALGKENALMFVHVFHNQRMVSTELLLKSPTTLYSFLGGTLEDAFEMRPNDLLKHETIRWGGENGVSFYVLGGGFRPNDGIFTYKEAFDPGNIMPFYIRQVVHQSNVYDHLVQKREQYETTQGVKWTPVNEFFPLYLS